MQFDNGDLLRSWNERYLKKSNLFIQIHPDEESDVEILF